MTDERRDTNPKKAEQARSRLEAESTRPEANRDVDRILKERTTQAAPASLMEGLMARIAQADTLPEAQPLKSTRALAAGLGLVALVSVPLLVVLSVTMLAIFGTGTAASGAAVGMMGLVVFLYTLVSGLLSGLEQFITANPLVFVLLACIPLAWWGLWWLGKQGEQQQHE